MIINKTSDCKIEDIKFDKPVKVYFIRHGQTQGNVEGYLQGKTDTPLNEVGLKQAEYLAAGMKETHLDAIYASNLQRAHITAGRLAEGRGEIAVVQDKRLQEVDGGVLESMTWEDVRKAYPEEYAGYTDKLHLFKAPEGESTYDVLDRSLAFLEEILPKHQGESVAIVAHGFLLACIINYCHGRSLEEAPYDIYDNTSISEIDFYGTREFEIIRLNDTNHLPK